MKLTIQARARLAILALALACGARAQEPVKPERPRAETLTADAPAESRPPRPGAKEVRAKPGQLNLDATAIRGNQELPKVMYIIPWKDPAMVELAGRPVNSLVEEVLAPVDREVFRRQNRYFSQLYGAGLQPSAPAVPDGPRTAGGE